jgi:hypothetical protein
VGLSTDITMDEINKAGVHRISAEELLREASYRNRKCTDWRAGFNADTPKYLKYDYDRLWRLPQYHPLRDGLEALLPFRGLWWDFQLRIKVLKGINCMEASTILDQ